MTTSESPDQNASPKTRSVSGETRSFSGRARSAGLMRSASRAAAVDLAWPMSQSRKRNWRERLDFSMVSSSVTVTRPLEEDEEGGGSSSSTVPPTDASSKSAVPTPISAKALRNSQPSAPAPTRNTRCLASLRWNSSPKTATCDSYRAREEDASLVAASIATSAGLAAGSTSIASK